MEGIIPPEGASAHGAKQQGTVLIAVTGYGVLGFASLAIVVVALAVALANRNAPGPAAAQALVVAAVSALVLAASLVWYAFSQDLPGSAMALLILAVLLLFVGIAAAQSNASDSVAAYIFLAAVACFVLAVLIAGVADFVNPEPERPPGGLGGRLQ